MKKTGVPNIPISSKFIEFIVKNCLKKKLQAKAVLLVIFSNF